MTPEIFLIQQLAEIKIFEALPETESDLRAWIGKSDYLLAAPLQKKGNHDTVSEFHLNASRTDLLYAAIANDCNRFCQASMESISGVGKMSRMPNSVGWPTIQMYYAAYFAAHAILRMFGRSCTQLDIEHARIVFSVAQCTQSDGGASAIEKGYYYARISSGEIHFKKLGNSHEDLWRSFHDLLIYIQANINNTTGLSTSKSNAFDLVSDIKHQISKNGANGGNWLSIIRNKINYQHTHGAWFPYKGAKHNPRNLFGAQDWQNDPILIKSGDGKDDIEALFCIANKIVSLMYNMLLYGHVRAGEISKPFRLGAMRFAKQVQVEQMDITI